MKDLSGIAGTIGAGIVLAYLLRSARPAARRDGDGMMVEYGRPMKIFVLILWLFFLGCVVAAVFFTPDEERVLAWSITTGFFLGVLSMHLEFFKVAIRYDSEGLHTMSPWRRKRFIPWSAIRDVRFSSFNRWYMLSTTNFGTVRLHVFLSGLESLLDELESRGFSIPTPPLSRPRPPKALDGLSPQK